jgi:hypothetical protein
MSRRKAVMSLVHSPVRFPTDTWPKMQSRHQLAIAQTGREGNSKGSATNHPKFRAPVYLPDAATFARP